MAAPVPKPKEERRNRVPPARGEWVDLEPLESPVLPDLPKGEEWSVDTRLTWEAWRKDPVTSQYTSADISFALHTIRLYEAMTPSSANEVRLRMGELGLTPKGKRDLRWRIPGQAVAEAKPKQRKARRRAHLTAVK